MPRIMWVGLGLIAGFFGRTMAGKIRRNLLLDLILAIVGALIGGWLFSHFGPTEVSELSHSSIIIDLISAAALLVFVQAISSSQ